MMVRHLAHAGHRPAIGVMITVADLAHDDTAWIVSADRLQTVRASVLLVPVKPDLGLTTSHSQPGQSWHVQPWKGRPVQLRKNRQMQPATRSRRHWISAATRSGRWCSPSRALRGRLRLAQNAFTGRDGLPGP
jgi:hypothetical protein